jgi:hypothetical protein
MIEVTGSVLMIIFAFAALALNFEMLIGFSFFEKCWSGALLLLPMITSIELRNVVLKKLRRENAKSRCKNFATQNFEQFIYLSIQKQLKQLQINFYLRIQSESIFYKIEMLQATFKRLKIVSFNLTAKLLPVPQIPCA